MVSTVLLQTRGGRGEGWDVVVRRSGAYGALPTDSDTVVLTKFADAAIAANPGFKGDDGAPGNAPFTNLKTYGGAPTLTESTGRAANTTALTSSLAVSAKKIVMGADTGNATVWGFNDFPTDGSMAGVTIETDPSVTVSLPLTSALFSASGRTLKHATPVKYRMRDLAVDYLALPESNIPVGQKVDFLGDSGPNWTKRAIMQPNTSEFSAVRIAWNASNTWVTVADDAAVAFTATTANSHTKTIATADGNWHIGQFAARPGRRYSARPVVLAGNPLLVALVRGSDNGYYGISSDLGGSPGVNALDKLVGSAGSSTSLGGFPWSTHSSYGPKNSVWSIDIQSWRRGSILCNDYQVRRFEMPVGVSITDAGFGLYATANGDSVQWVDHVKTWDHPFSTGVIDKSIFFGDSLNQQRHGCPADFYKRALDQTGGVRCIGVDIAAVGGHRSADQLTVMSATDLSPYNHVHIPVGTNDVQGAVAVATSMSNISAMYDLAKLNGRDVTMAVFPLWYGQGQAGAGIGQASTNYEAGAALRLAILRFCALNGIPCLDLTMFTGPVIAHYVNGGLGLDLRGTGDSVVFDNIHLTELMNRIAGRELAKIRMGMMVAKPSLRLDGQLITPQSGYTAADAPIYSIDDAGQINRRGFFNVSGGPTTDGSVFLKLDRHVRPDRTLRMPLRGSTGWGQANMDPNGDVSMIGLSGTTFLDVSNLNHPLTGL